MDVFSLQNNHHNKDYNMCFRVFLKTYKNGLRHVLALTPSVTCICHREKKKVYVGNDQEMAQSERNSHSINRGVGKN